MKTLSERGLVGLIGAIQFVNILDFMMVMPLGPDFARALGIPTSQIGLVGGSYTFAAAVAAIVSARFIDRFDRRVALALAVLGLALGTLAAALAVNLATLMLARVVAGAFGGPATSLALAIIIDSIPAERRGRALGAVMGAFSVAAVLGVPAGLELARLGGWQAPFVAVGLLGLVAALAAWKRLPPLRGHLEHAIAFGPASLRRFLGNGAARLALAAMGLAMIAAFLIIPNVSAFVQFNLGYPREHLGLLYLAGGALSFFAMRAGGHLTDRWGAVTVAWLGTLLLVGVLLFGFLLVPPPLPVVPMFAAFMVAMGVRGVAANTTITRVPAPHERAGFMSLNSAVQHIAAAAGAMGSSALLDAAPDGALRGVPSLAAISITLALTLPLLLARLDRRLVAMPRPAVG
ncbi:MAG TPA: MFS transporter [Gammaproteobacteria bacterium]|nr:MFS transporter [Gammaproteobacteria bacterium]